MAQLGKAYIEVRADLSKFPAELRAELQKALKEGTAGVTFEELDKKASAAGKKAAHTLGDEFEHESHNRLKKSGEKAGRDVGDGFFGVLRKLFTSNRSGGGFFSTVGDLFSGFAKSAEQGVGQLQSAGEKISEIGGKIGEGFSAIGSGIKTGFIVLAIPAVVGLIAVLVQLSGALFALPAGIALVAATFAPLLIAMHGVADAVGAGFSGDVDKYNEALKKLAPSARAVVKEIVGLKGAFEAIKRNTQQAFFEPLVGSFKALQGTLLPALNRGLATAAAALGRFVAGFLELLSEPEIVKDISATFTTLARIVDKMAPVAANVFGAIFGLIKTGLPFVEQFSAYLAKAADALVNLLARAQGGGKIAAFIQGAAQPFKELVRLVGVFGDLFFTIFGNADIQKAGNDFLNYLTDAVGLLDKFFHSAEGKKVLKDFADAIEHAGVILVGVVGIVIGLLEALHYLNQALGTAIKAVGAFFQFVGGLAVSAGKAIIGFFVDSGKAISDVFTKAIPGWLSAIGGFFASIGGAIADFFTKTIPGWFNSVVDFFKALPNRVGDGLTSLRGTIINGFKSAFIGVIDDVTRNIGRVIGLILASPILIKQGLSTLGTIIHDAFFAALHGAEDAVSASVNTIGTFFGITLPNLIGQALVFVGNLIVSAWHGILDFFAALGPAIANHFVTVYHAIVDGITNAVSDARKFVVEGFNAVVDFFSNLPNRIAALGPRLLNAAKDLGRQIGNGLKDIGDFASDIGKDIVNTVKSGINHVIRSINSGINDIGGSIGVHLPNIPQLAKGGIIDSPTLAILGEKGKREVVIPLTDPSRAQQLAQQSGLTQVLARGGGQPIVNITAILGTGQILDILDQRVSTAFDAQGAELAYGTR